MEPTTTDTGVALATVPAAIAGLRAGNYVFIVDDEDRENEGDLCIAAELTTAEHITFMSRHAGGRIRTALKSARLDELEIAPMVGNSTSRSLSVEAGNLTPPHRLPVPLPAPGAG